MLLLENQFPQDFKMMSHDILILHACISKYDEINGRAHNAAYHAGAAKRQADFHSVYCPEAYCTMPCSV